jgi:hypothetical protein
LFPVFLQGVFPDGKADAEIPFRTGRTDRNGYFCFQPDAPGRWKITIKDEDGHFVRMGIKDAESGAGLTEGICPLTFSEENYRLSCCSIFFCVRKGRNSIFAVSIASMVNMRQKRAKSEKKPKNIRAFPRTAGLFSFCSAFFAGETEEDGAPSD